MAKAKKKIGIVDFVILGILVVCLVLAIVGLSIDQWTTTDGIQMDVSFGDYSEMAQNINETNNEVDDALGDWGGIFDDTEVAQSANEKNAELNAMVAFGYITVILIAATLVLYVLKMFLKAGLFRILAGIAGILTLISGVLAIAMTAAVCGEIFVIGAGAGLLAAGGMLAGLAGGSALFIKK